MEPRVFAKAPPGETPSVPVHRLYGCSPARSHDISKTKVDVFGKREVLGAASDRTLGPASYRGQK